MEVMILRVKTSRRVRTLGVLIGLSLLLSFPMTAQADSVSLAWDSNTEPDLGGYKLYMGTSPGSYSQIFDVGHVTSYTVSNLLAGDTYYFALTAYDIYANESGFSPEISTTISQAFGSAAEDTTSSSSEGESTTASSEDKSTTASSEDKSTTAPDSPNTWYSWLWKLLFG